VQLDKTGRYLFISLSPPPDSAGKMSYIRDLQTGAMDGLATGPPDYSLGHPDLGTGIHVGWDGTDNRFVYRELAAPRTSLRTVLALGSDWTQSIHTSLRGVNETWALVGFFSEKESSPRDGLFHNELVLINTDGSGSVRRLAHHHTVNQNNYFNQPRANLSRDGKFVAFTSNWGGSTQRDLFIGKLP
jgi:hypothetical protein